MTSSKQYLPAEGGSPLGALYDVLREKHRFALARERVRVARNGAFAGWDEAPRDGDEIAFLPPVSGG